MLDPVSDIRYLLCIGTNEPPIESERHMTVAFSKDTNDTRTSDGRNRHGYYEPSLETAKCLASVFADLEELDGLRMDRDDNEWLCLVAVLESHA